MISDLEKRINDMQKQAQLDINEKKRKEIQKQRESYQEQQQKYEEHIPVFSLTDIAKRRLLRIGFSVLLIGSVFLGVNKISKNQEKKIENQITIQKLPDYAKKVEDSITLPSGHYKTGLSGIHIKENGTLTLSPNTTIYFDKDSRLVSNGSLLAISDNPSEPITFTAIDNKSKFPAKKRPWSGIYLKEGSDSSQLKNCIIEYTKASNRSTIPLRIEDASPTIEFTTICNNKAKNMIYIKNSNAKITNCTIENNYLSPAIGKKSKYYSASAIHMKKSNPTITNTRIQYNTQAKKGELINYNHKSNPLLENNIIRDNKIENE